MASHNGKPVPAIVSVIGLFGDLNHEIVLHIDDGLTIVHGPNGVGKTTVLRIIDLTFKHQLRQLASIPFRSVSFDFMSGERLTVSRRAAEEKNEDFSSLLFGLRSAQRRSPKPFEWTGGDPRGRHVPYSLIDDFIPHLDRVGPRRWYDSISGEALSVDDVLDRYGDRIPEGLRRELGVSELPDWLAAILGSTSTAYIRAQRLSMTDPRNPQSHRGEPREAPTVTVFSRELVQNISSTLAKYAEFSQSLDSTFPSRVLASGGRGDSDQLDITRRYEMQNRRRSAYQAVGLLDDAGDFSLPDRAFVEGELKMLATYLADVDEKLEQLADLAAKIGLFQEIVNSKFRRKALSISRQDGFVVSNDAGQNLRLTDLSSGEQQELVLAFELLFRYPQGTLVLIDESELSLHVSWQMAFIDDLLKVSALTGLQFIVATHSPQIINERWDLTSRLSDRGDE